jgi:hypothetical protein
MAIMIETLVVYKKERKTSDSVLSMMVHYCHLFKEYFFFHGRRNQVHPVGRLLCFHMKTQCRLSGKFKFCLVI